MKGDKMPEQSVRQFRPDAMDMLYEDPGFPRPLDSEISQLLAYIERLENALDHIGERTLTEGGELFPVGPEDIEWEQDGNTIKQIMPPWYFLGGKGQTLLEAIEADKERKHQ